MNENWFKDIMNQRFQLDTYFDPTKLIFAVALTEGNTLLQRYSYSDICRILRRYYISNTDIAAANVNIVIRNIKKYGVNDLKPILALNIKLWIKDQLFNSISCDDNYIYLNIDNYSKEQLELTRKLCFTLFKKYYKQPLKEIFNANYTYEIDDRKMAFGCSDFKEYALEDFQYCPLSEETDIDKLFVTHIFFKDEGATKEECLNPANCLLLGYEEWRDYVQGKFYFDEFGRVKNISSNVVSNKMRISLSLINGERKTFIKKHIEAIAK